MRTWMKRIEVAKSVKDSWSKQYRVEDCYQYWRGKQRDEPTDGLDRKAQHNMMHPDVDEQIPSVYFYEPYGKVVASPGHEDTPGETITQKCQLLQDTGIALTRDKKAGFRENSFLALKESYWAFGVVETGYDPDFIENPMAERPPLRENEDVEATGLPPEPGGLGYGLTQNPQGVPAVQYPQDQNVGGPVRDQMGLTAGAGSDYQSLKAELKRLRGTLGGETFYVKYIPSTQVFISASDRPVMETNDFICYYEDYAIEDVKASTAYSNTDDLEPTADLGGPTGDDATARVRLWRIYDFRTRNKITLAQGHDKFLMQREWKCGGLQVLRHDIDPYHFYPIPPLYLKLDAQDEYNDSAEYLRKQRIGTVPRYTFDEDAVDPTEAAKFQSRDMNVMIPRKAGTHAAIEPVSQPTTSQTAIQTLALGEKEFIKASSSSGDPLSPPTQTATRAALAANKINSLEGFKRNIVGTWLGFIIEDLLLLAIDYMSLEKWVAINVDMDSVMAPQAASIVAQTFQLVTAEKLRYASIGLEWHIEVETDTLTPVAESERGQKLMEVLNFISNPSAAALMTAAPNLLKRIMSLAGIRNGSDVDALLQGLQAIVSMNQMAAAGGASTPGISPTGGSTPLPPGGGAGSGPGGPPPGPGPVPSPAGVPLPIHAGRPA